MKNKQNPPRMKAKEYSIKKMSSGGALTLQLSKTQKQKRKEKRAANKSDRIAGKAIRKMQNAKSPEKAEKIANRFSKKNY